MKTTPYAVVYFEHESIYYVSAQKIFEGTWQACLKIFKAKGPDYSIVRNFEGSECNANYVQDLTFEY